MVHDHFDRIIPNPLPPDNQGIGWFSGSGVFPHVCPDISTQIAELKKLIADFKEAVEAAKKVDALTGQPDCVDPAKQKLEDRVAELERKIAKFEAQPRRPERIPLRRR